MNKSEKQEQISKLAGSFAKAQIALCADYRGLTVQQITTLRKNLSNAGATARVVKNKLAKIAVDKGEQTDETSRFRELFRGPSFVVFSDTDPVAPTKVLADFVKTAKSFQIKGAWVDGRFVDAAGVEALSKLPGKAELLGQLLSLFNAPATKLVGLLQAPAAQVVRLLEAQRKNLEEKGAAA